MPAARHALKRMRAQQRGAALLMAMMIVALIATLATAMVWQQWRAVQIEGIERARVQATWILQGALDWARLILREDRNQTDDLTDVWATPLAEARLSTFLAADKENNADTGPEVFLSGSIVDATARFNLRNLVGAAPDYKPVPDQVAILKRLCTTLNVTDVSTTVATAMSTAFLSADESAPLPPQAVEQLTWMGVDPATLAKLTPYVVVLPATVATKVNFNTASRELIMAVADLDGSTAARIVQSRQGKPFKTVQEVSAAVVGAKPVDVSLIDVQTNWFEVRGRLRLDKRIIEETSIVHRNQPGGDVKAYNRRRESMRELNG